MKPKKELKQKKTVRSAINQKKSPSLKLAILKQTAAVNSNKKFIPKLQQKEQNNNTKEMIQNLTKTKRKNCESNTDRTVKQKNKVQESENERNLARVHGQERTLSGKNKLRFMNSNHNLLKKQQKSRSLKELSFSSYVQSESATQPRLKRYNKFQFRSQKYLKLNTELGINAQTNEKQHHQTVKKLNKDIEHFKNMYEKSLRVLSTMERVMKSEKQQFQMEKKQYQTQIKNLRMKIEEKKINLGHLYTYKEWEVEKLIPEIMILEKFEESPSEISCNGFEYGQIHRAEKIMEFYLSRYNQQSENQEQQKDSSKKSEESEECLSINSK